MARALPMAYAYHCAVLRLNRLPKVRRIYAAMSNKTGNDIYSQLT